MPGYFRNFIKPCKTVVTAHTWSTEVLCFEADELAKMLKNEMSSYD